MRIVIAGPKGAGKSMLGEVLSKLIGITVLETDRLIESLYQETTGQAKTVREIYIEHGKDYFRDLESRVAQQMWDVDWQLVVTGGSILLSPQNRRALRFNAILVYLTTDVETAWNRAVRHGVLPWLDGHDGRRIFEAEWDYRNEVILPYADLAMRPCDIETHGRHDPCLVPRVIPVVESMAALALLDAWQVQARLNPAWAKDHPLA
jgi:shikimate kinase